jgi:hypothetical protein
VNATYQSSWALPSSVRHSYRPTASGKRRYRESGDRVERRPLLDSRGNPRAEGAIDHDERLVLGTEDRLPVLVEEFESEGRPLGRPSVSPELRLD